MPHVSSSGDGGDELATEDEIKLYKHEGEEDKTSSENLTEDKSDLIDLTESEEKVALAGGSYATTGKASTRSDLSPVFVSIISNIKMSHSSVPILFPSLFFFFFFFCY
ncbi:hypothetical protein ACFW04_003940 [Cataglyphis niger]